MKSFKKKLRGKAVISLIVIVGLVLSMAAVGIVPASAEEESDPLQFAQDTIQGGAVLHCFCWSYNAIKEKMEDIAAAGYTAIQTSPVQAPKDYSASYMFTANEWWKLYQPLTIGIAGDGKTWLGTKEELKSMCEEAEKYNIKVIVDIVANHMANNGTNGGTFANLSANVESDMRQEAFFHTDTDSVDDSSRLRTTHGHLGMPDLNTGNDYVQNKVIHLLWDCIGCGVDGFRFDAAKHIETPGDEDGIKSNFWRAVIETAKREKSDAFFYGEILGLGGIPNIGHYTRYMAVTDNVTGDKLLNYANTHNIGGLADSQYYKGTEPAESIIWAESHDTYMGDSGMGGITNTSGVSDEVIERTWAIVGSRADSTALFFARPEGRMGYASRDDTWKSDVVSEVNKFKNFFDGTSEYLSYDSTPNVTYNERGTAGVVIVSDGESKSVTLKAHKMKDGTYTDHISGNTFTVSDGWITGTLGTKGIAVVYNLTEEPYVPDETEETNDLSYSLFGYIDGRNYACEEDGSNLGQYRFENGWLEMTFAQDSYVAVKTIKDNAALNWYMTDGWLGEVTSGTLKNTNVTGNNSNKLMVPAGKVYLHLTDNGDDTFTLSYTTEEPSPTIVGRTAALGSDIGLNYYVDLGTADPADAQVKFTWDKGEETVDLANAYYDIKGGFKATSHIAAKEMTDEVTVTLIVDGQEVESRTDSVCDYLNAIIASPDVYGADAVTLSKAALTYGAEAQKLFGYKTDTLADSGVTDYTPDEINVSRLRPFRLANADFAEHGLTLDGASLRLESDTVMRLYFIRNDTSATLPALTNGKTEYEANVNGTEVWYDITGFSAGTLTKSRELRFTDSADGKSFLINVGAYTKAALASTDPDDDQLKATLKALYGYDSAAANY